jgi:hypothetical protein
MIPVFEHDEGKLVGRVITRGTFDKTSSGPFHLGRHDYTRGRAAGPCNACTGLDAERASTGYIRSTRRRQRHNIVIKITI